MSLLLQQLWCHSLWNFLDCYRMILRGSNLIQLATIQQCWLDVHVTIHPFIQLWHLQQHLLTSMHQTMWGPGSHVRLLYLLLEWVQARLEAYSTVNPLIIFPIIMKPSHVEHKLDTNTSRIILGHFSSMSSIF